MEFLELNYETDDNIKVLFKVADDLSALYCKIIGQIYEGSMGNDSCDYLFGKVAQYFVQVNPLVTIFDCSELAYTFGDRLSKTLNIYSSLNYEDVDACPVFVITGNNCHHGIISLLEFTKEKNIKIVADLNGATQLTLAYIKTI